MLVANDAFQATHIVPPDSSSKVFDDACGIGTVTAEVKKHYPDIPVLAIDSSAGMLEVFNRKVKKHGLKDVEARLLDGGKLTGMFCLRLVQLTSIYLRLFFRLSTGLSVFTLPFCAFRCAALRPFRSTSCGLFFDFPLDLRPVCRCLH